MDLWRAWEWLYSDFNYIEAVTWCAVGLRLLWKLYRRDFPKEKSTPVLLAGITFLFFGLSDILEARFEINGTIPLWIWAWKIFCGAILVKCRYAYYGIDRRRFVDRYSVFLLLIFLIVLTLVIWTWLTQFAL